MVVFRFDGILRLSCCEIGWLLTVVVLNAGLLDGTFIW